MVITVPVLDQALSSIQISDKTKLIYLSPKGKTLNQNVSKKDKVKFWLYRLADYIVPNSHSQAQFIKNNFPKVSNKIVTITNFTDTAHFHPIEASSNEKVNILTAARIASQKNILNYLSPCGA